MLLKSQTFIASLLLFVTFALSVQTVQAQTVAFVNVHVIPMDSERILEDRTVIIQDGKISDIGPSDQLIVPDGVDIIDGEGGYLMPGLADMHTHLGVFDNDPRHLLLYLAEGTTTVRTLTGSQLELNWRDQVQQGELLGPSILVGRTMFGMYQDSIGLNGFISMFRLGVFAFPLVFIGLAMLLGFLPRDLLIGLGALGIGVLSWILPYPAASPTLSTLLERPDVFVSESPSQAVEEVQRMHQAGFDFFKAYDGLTELEFVAAVRKANALGFYTLGHLPNQIPMEKAFSTGLQEIAHMDELLSFHWIDYDPNGENDPELLRKGFSVNFETIPDTVAVLQAYDVSVVANLSTDEVLYRLVFDTPGVLAGPEYAVIRPQALEAWATTGRNVTSFAEQGPNRRDEVQPFLEELTLALHEAGVVITIGTDSNVEGCIPSNIHREFELLVKAGLSDYEALVAGTKAANEVAGRMGKGNHFGTVEVGKRADLILLNHNPLENVSHTRDRKGVMVQGVWHTQEELDAMVQAFVSTY